MMEVHNPENPDTGRIKELLNRVRKIEITTRHKASEILTGHYRSAFRGRGIEFSEVRDYVFGDSINQIEWNVTARMAKPFVKQFVEERELNIILAIDVSPSMYYGSFPREEGKRGSQRKYKIDIASEIAATIAVSASMNNDKIGLVLYDDMIQKYLPQKKSKDQPLRILRELIGYRPRSASADIRQAMRYIMNVQKKRGVLFLISDFDSIGNFKEFTIAKKRFDIIPVIIQDKREFELENAGFVTVYDPETKKELVLNTKSRKVRDSYKKIAEEKLLEKKTIFLKKGIEFIEIYTDGDFYPKLIRFFKRREKILSI